MQLLVFGSPLPISIQVILLSMIFFKVNHMLGGRIYLANKSLNLYGFGFLDDQFTGMGMVWLLKVLGNYQTYLYVDNLYVQILQIWLTHPGINGLSSIFDTT